MTAESKGRLLVVEDNTFWRTAEVDALVEAGYQVQSCADGMDAIEILNRVPPDLVVLDYFLPKVDGHRICAFVKGRPDLSHIPTVILSGALVGGIDREALPDADAAIAKGPLNDTLPRLVEIVGDLLRQRRTAELREQIVEPAQLEPRELTRKLTYLKSYLDTLHAELTEAIFEVDGRRRVVRLNPSALALTDRTEPELLGEDALVVLQAEADSSLALAVAAALSGAGSSTRGFAAHVFGERHLETTVSRLFHGPDKPGAIIVCRDTTERHRAKAALRDTVEQLRHSQKMEAIGRLAGGVAHDFNNLLTSISGYVSILKLRLASQAELKELEQIQLALDQAGDLTRQLLAFASKQVVSPRVVDVNQVIRQMRRMIERLLDEDIELVTALAPELGQIKIDPGQIEQILMNLAVNARDAMPAGGTLTVATANVALDEPLVSQTWELRPGAYVSLVVTDTGSGMDAETAEHIFEPFFTTKAEGQGTGLGLATLYGIVKQAGGSIAVRTAPDEGASFTIQLPRCDEATTADGEADTAPADAGPGGDETVLVAEDHAQVRELIARTLTEQGYDVLSAADGHQAAEILREIDPSPDLLIADVVMPRKGGRELGDLASKLAPGIKVLYISGYARSTGSRPKLAAPPSPLLAKPFQPGELLRKVREVLDGDG